LWRRAKTPSLEPKDMADYVYIYIFPLTHISYGIVVTAGALFKLEIVATTCACVRVCVCVVCVKPLNSQTELGIRAKSDSIGLAW
jgi:hypothetical protein